MHVVVSQHAYPHESFHLKSLKVNLVVLVIFMTMALSGKPEYIPQQAIGKNPLDSSYFTNVQVCRLKKKVYSSSCFFVICFPLLIQKLSGSQVNDRCIQASGVQGPREVQWNKKAMAVPGKKKKKSPFSVILLAFLANIPNI